MKTYLFCFLLFICSDALSQGRFVRIYDMKADKIAKGKIIAVNDTALRMFHSERGNFSVPISKINYILTCRSGGHNIGMGALICGVSGMIIGGATANPDDWFGYTVGEGVALGAISGGIIGTLFGGMTVILKGTERVNIQGDRQKIREYLSRY